MKRIGIIGGGQLGKMMILDAKRLDYYFVILDPVKNCPADSIADDHIIAGFDDLEAIRELANMVDVVTYEFEHISVNALKLLEANGHKVYPTSQTLEHIQNKLEQKRWLKSHNISVPDFIEITDWKDLAKAGELFSYPFILKTCTGGYDGKGNGVIHSKEELSNVYEALGAGRLPLMAEKWVAFEKEISVLACRSTSKEVRIYPIAENYHVDSILDETVVPANISEYTEQAAGKIAIQALDVFDSYGMLCIELFVTKDGGVLVNELAPRPHNSGHYTIEGCYTSQYENHIRAVSGLPLGDTSLIRPTAMKNLIGDKSGKAIASGIQSAYENPLVKLHIYGKTKVSNGRKMGHITASAQTIEEALKAVRYAHARIHF